MTTSLDEMSADLPCHVCNYDLRAHPPEGTCPECGASVAEARRWAGIPRRPAWAESDPRWRRRMLAGVWVLVFLPLMDLLIGLQWTSIVPVPTVFDYRGAVRTLRETLLATQDVYQPVAFCIGVVLLFAKERGRRPGRWDWTRRWGVICSYVVFLLSAVPILFIGALVLIGISSIFLSMPPEHQPSVTPLFIRASTGYLWYGAHPGKSSGLVLIAFSSITVLFAGFALYEALRSSGLKVGAAVLPGLLAFLALLNLANLVRYCLGIAGVTEIDVARYILYFDPTLLASCVPGVSLTQYRSGASTTALILEVGKWCIVLAIAIWLSIAHIMAWRRKARAA